MSVSQTNKELDFKGIKVVEAAGIEPASKGCDQCDLHVYSIHLIFATDEQMNRQDLIGS